MARFKGNNNQPTIRLMFERANYAKFAFPENNGVGPPGIKDFNRWEMTKFGRINDNGNAIVPRAMYIKPIVDTIGITETSSALNFVTDAFVAMKKHLRRAFQKGILRPDHPFLSDFAAHRGYESPMYMHDKHTSSLLAAYNYSFLSDKFYRERVRNFGDYVHYFLDFMRVSSDAQPFTFTGFQRSRHSSIYTSGLVVDIAGADLSEDELKDDFFISAPEFSYYFKLAKYYGFMLNKNAPFVLVADINSPAMRPYIQENNMQPNSVINTVFMQVYPYDVERIESLMIEYYNLYVAGAPYIKEVSFCTSGKPRHKITSRNQTNIELVRKKYRPRYFLNFYIDLRNIEELYPFQKADIRRIKQKAGFFYRTRSPRASLDYVNEQFRSLYAAKEGTLHHWKQQQKMKKMNK